MDPYYLRLHGSLSAVQKQALSSGQRVPISSLSPTQRTYVDEIVFGGRTPRLALKRPAKEGGETDYWNRIDTEPTIHFGNGIPASTLLSMTNNSGLSIHADGTYQGQYASSQDFSLSSIGDYLAEKDRPGGSNWNTGHEWTSFQAEDKTEYRYEIEPEPDWSYAGTLTQRVPRGPKVSALDKFPPDIWKLIQDEVEKAKARRNGNKIPPRR